MADRKQFLKGGTVDPELVRIMDGLKGTEVSEEELHEQRISFAYGNALHSDGITKDSVRHASQHIRLKG